MSLVTIFIIKSTLSDIYMDISALFWLLFAWYVFFHLFSFNLPAPLNLKCISGRQCVVSSLLFLRILAYWVKCLVTHIQLPYKVRFGLPRWLSGKESTCQCRRLRRCKFDPWVGKIPWRRNWQSTLVFLLGKFHGQRSLAVRGFSKSLTWLNEHNPTQERFTPVIAICWLYVSLSFFLKFLCFSIMVFFSAQ